MKRIGILGAGTWGMALARMLTVSGNDVLVWSAIEKEIDSLSTTRKHPNLPQMKIPDELRFTKSIEEVCKDKDILLFAVPSVFVRSTAAKARPYVAVRPDHRGRGKGHRARHPVHHDRDPGR